MTRERCSFVGGFGELVDELRSGRVADPSSLFARRDAEADEEVGLAGAGVAEEHNGFAGVEVGARREGRDGGGVDRGRRVEVEVGEAFGAREVGFVDAALAAPFDAFVDLGGEDLGEEAEVALLGALGDLSEAGGIGADHGEAQFSGGGPDGCGGSGVGHLGHWASRKSS